MLHKVIFLLPFFWLLGKYSVLGALFNPRQPFSCTFSPEVPRDDFLPLENGEKLVISDTNQNYGNIESNAL